MAETESIAKMAEMLSREIFRPFGWTNHPLYNENFACLNQEAHKLKTHPTDTVFSYTIECSFSILFTIDLILSLGVKYFSMNGANDS